VSFRDISGCRMLTANTESITSEGADFNDTAVKQPQVGRRDDTLRLQNAQSLDRNTLGGIYDEYHPLLYSYIFRRVGDMEIARDLTADVFRRFLQATASGKGPNDQLRAWLYRVAHNIVVDHYRRGQNRQKQPLTESLASGEAEPDSIAEQRIQCDTVRSALEQLTAEQQEVIALKFLEGMTNDEVANITKRSVGAVKALQHRALAALRRQLDPQQGEAST
jgi:RNA polymerase sigma-70 factor, ECF subfamily